MSLPDCPGDLIARERRALLSSAERACIEAHVASCAACQLGRQLSADFEAVGAMRVGDDARVARIALAVAQAAARKQQALPARSARRWPVLLAAALVLVAVGAGATWLGQAGQSERASRAVSLLERPAAGQALRQASAAPALPTAAGSNAPAAELGPSELARQSHEAPREATPGDADSAAALFARANEARRRGNPAGAIALYQRLQAQFPASAEGRLARVSLGRLLLERGSPEAALSEFDRYLTGAPGSLAVEALYGRARALAALGRVGQERAAWQRLLSEFPGSVYAATAKARLGESP